MTGSDNWSRELTLVRKSGAVLEPGLSATELLAAEDCCGARFPSDLRELLGSALPVGPRFPDWRSLPKDILEWSLEGPFEGIRFDIEHNSFWWPAWGPRPAELSAAIDLARRSVAAAPRLIPVYGHRYLPADPLEPGNPVFSVVQTDIICYGRDLRSYFAHEFGGVGYLESITPEPRNIRFWSDLVRRNNARAG